MYVTATGGGDFQYVQHQFLTLSPLPPLAVIGFGRFLPLAVHCFVRTLNFSTH
jgi:hypothetical protein